MGLLLEERPLVILPSLAEKVGLNESIVLQQLHYWLKKSTNNKNGYKWVYNTYKDWQDQFPFWSERTIRRTITKLENDGYIITGNFNKLKIDNTKWYRINYDKLVSRPPGQSGQTDRTDWPHGHGQDGQAITIDYTETTTDIYIPYSEIVSYLNEKAGTRYRHTTRKTKELIRARWNEKNTLDDFKIVIDKKTNEWIGTDMAQYLRPETLFGTKFESYLNQIDKNKPIPPKQKGEDPTLLKLRRLQEEANAR